MRWAGEFIRRYSVGKDGKTAAERLKVMTSAKPLAQFGEHVLYLPLKAANTEEDKTEPRMKPGVCLGLIDRTEEVMIGTDAGVVMCRAVKRRPEGQQWCKEAIANMKGSVRQPVPGVPSDRTPTGIKEEGSRETRPSRQKAPKPKEPASRPQTKAGRATTCHEDLREGCLQVCPDARVPSLYRDTAGSRRKKGWRDSEATLGRLPIRMKTAMSRDPSDQERVSKEEGKMHKQEEEEAAQTKVELEEEEEEAKYETEDAPRDTTTGDDMALNVSQSIRKWSVNVLPASGETIYSVATAGKDSTMTATRDGDFTEFEQFLGSIQVGFADAVREAYDVTEVHSVLQVNEAAKKMGLKVGWTLDICTRDENGSPWDFTAKAEMRNKAARKLIEDKPPFIIGSPPCTDWSTWTNLNWHRMDPDTVARRRQSRVAQNPARQQSISSPRASALGYVVARRHDQRTMRIGRRADSSGRPVYVQTEVYRATRTGLRTEKHAVHDERRMRSTPVVPKMPQPCHARKGKDTTTCTS